jgi:hypothetical protein
MIEQANIRGKIQNSSSSHIKCKALSMPKKDGKNSSNLGTNGLKEI